MHQRTSGYITWKTVSIKNKDKRPHVNVLHLNVSLWALKLSCSAGIALCKSDYDHFYMYEMHTRSPPPCNSRDPRFEFEFLGRATHRQLNLATKNGGEWQRPQIYFCLPKWWHFHDMYRSFARCPLLGCSCWTQGKLTVQNSVSVKTKTKNKAESKHLVMLVP